MPATSLREANFSLARKSEARWPRKRPPLPPALRGGGRQGSLFQRELSFVPFGSDKVIQQFRHSARIINQQILPFAKVSEPVDSIDPRCAALAFASALSVTCPLISTITLRPVISSSSAWWAAESSRQTVRSVYLLVGLAENRTARSFRQLRRFHHVINSDKVFGTHTTVPVVNQIRRYWWCNPPSIGQQLMCPALSTARGTGASFSRDRWVRISM